ncbi:MAG: DUF1343 domain-containing protein [Verrucomicrobiota bacterium]
MPRSFAAKLLALLALFACLNILSDLQISTTAQARVKLGIDVLADTRFEILRGKRVGLLTHQAGVNQFGQSTIDVLRNARQVQLVKLFGPEHGIYGDEKANVPVLDKIDPRTNLPVYSLFGKYRKPTAGMLSGLDVLVIDLQDLGVRSYTYAACMRYAMEAAIENNLEVVVLDRPNPLGGLKVDGPNREEKWRSYVGDFPVPYVHGLTMGELARMAVSEKGILNLSDAERKSAKLSVVTMEGWNRYMSWTNTGLSWIPTSPNIPTFESVVGYSMTGLGAQLGGFKHGIGSEYPFRILTFDKVKLDALKKELEARNIPGVAFETKQFMSGQKEGLYVKITDWKAWRPTELSFHMMQVADKFSRSNPFASTSEGQGNLFNKHVGSSRWWQEITQRGQNSNLSGFIVSWERQAKQFQYRTRKYWLYD